MKLYIALGIIVTITGLSHAKPVNYPSDLEDYPDVKQAVERTKQCVDDRVPSRGKRQNECARIIFEACPDHDRDTMSIARCLQLEREFWEHRLNKVEQDLLTIYRENDETIGGWVDVAPRFEKAQATWRAWLEAETGYVYAAPRGTAGRTRAPSRAITLLADRVLYLETMLYWQRN